MHIYIPYFYYFNVVLAQYVLLLAWPSLLPVICDSERITLYPSGKKKKIFLWFVQFLSIYTTYLAFKEIPMLKTIYTAFDPNSKVLICIVKFNPVIEVL